MTPTTPTEAAAPPQVDLPRAELSDNARIVLAKRYLKKDAAGQPVEVPEEMFWRVAYTIASADRKYGATDEEVATAAREFYALMTKRLFEPNSPTLMNAGRPLGQLSACFVLPVDDALSNNQSGVYDTLRSMAMVHQSGGGTGFSFSRIRPSGDLVRSTTGVASGPVSFMSLYDSSTEVVKQGGCVVPDTLVSTSRGIVPIRELGPAHAEADSWHPHATALRVSTDTSPRDSDEFYVHGVAPVRRIRTRSGYHFAATLPHRIRVVDDAGKYVWRRMEELREGDWVALQKGHMMEPEDRSLPALQGKPHFNAGEVTLPAEASARFGEFLGYLVGDGTFNRYNPGGSTWRLALSVADAQPEVGEWVVETVRELFGVTCIVNKKADDASTNYFVNATTVGNWLEQIGVSKASALEARVPDLVFRKGVETARGFLRGLFTADGTVSDEGYPSLSSVSPTLIDGVQQLLLAVGVPSARSVVTDRESAFGDNPLHRLRVVTQAGREVFAHQIGFIDEERSARALNTLEKAWEHNDVIPHPAPALAAAYAGPGRGTGPGRASRGADRGLYRDIQHYLPGVAAPRNLTRSRLAKLAEKHAAIKASEDLMRFLEQDQYYDQIESIEEDESLTLDLSVPETNTYVANGFVSHNTRRGANMGILRVDHPDILGFIDCKQDITKITNFNISVAVTDAFMNAVQRGEQYDIVNPRNGQVTGQLDARTVWDKVVQNAWRTGEPGVFYVDRANFYNPVPHLGAYEATNPCGEQPLLPYDVCNLGSVNVGLFVRDDVPTESPWYEKVDWKEFRRVVRHSTHFLDNVIDANQYPLPEITDLANRIRRIGLGVMGYADLLIRLGVPYNSAEGVEIGRRIMEFLDEESKKESERLAEVRGVFPEWEKSIWGPDETCARAPNGDRIRPMRRLRNCNVTTVAPTGTISIFAGCSSGIEPLFAVAFMRNQAGSLMPDVNEEFVRVAKAGGWYSEDLMRRIAESGHIHFPEVPEAVQRAFVTAHDITPEWHVRQQAGFQEYCDSAISKTTNFPNEATVEQVREIYELAYKLNCKGVTVYRDGSRDNQVLSTGATRTPAQQAAESADVAAAHSKLAEAAEREAKLEREVARLRTALATAESQVTQARRLKRKRPDVLRGTTRKMTSPLGDVFVTINEDGDRHPFEVFATLGKAGSVAMADVEAIGRLISLSLRFGVPVNDVYQQLRGISSDRAIGFGQNKVLSLPDAIAQAIGLREQEKAGIQQELIPEAVLPLTNVDVTSPELAAVAQPSLNLGTYDPGESFMGTCPECNSQLEFAEGCMKCHACGYSECG